MEISSGDICICPDSLADADDGQIVARYARPLGRPAGTKEASAEACHYINCCLPPKHAAVSKSGVLSCNFVYQRQIQCEQSAAAAKVPPINLLVSLALALTTDSLPVRDGTICIERIEEY